MHIIVNVFSFFIFQVSHTYRMPKTVAVERTRNAGTYILEEETRAAFEQIGEVVYNNTRNERKN